MHLFTLKLHRKLSGRHLVKNMAQIFPQQLQNLGLALDEQGHTGQLSYELDKCGATDQTEKISRLDQKKGG